MKRREFILAIGGAAAWPLGALAQQAAMPVIGFLDSGSPSGMEAYLAGFLRGLNEAGYSEGQNVAIEYRWAEGQMDQLTAFAAELVRQPVNVIVGSREPEAGFVVTPGSTMLRNRNLVISLAARHGLLAVYPERVYAIDGGLMSYGTADLIEPFRQAASYIDRILRGERPADLPVQAPTRYSTVVNLKTAKMLGLNVPSSLMLAADEVIE